jgi:hypothetical protein
VLAAVVVSGITVYGLAADGLDTAAVRSSGRNQTLLLESRSG